MTTSDLKNFLNYLSDVLGIKQVLTPKADVTVASFQLIISVSDLSSYNSEETQLLHKMISALQLEDISYRIQDTSEVIQPAAYHLILMDQISSSGKQLPNTVTTFSPRKLLQDPQLKKVAWSEMQILLQKIKNA